MSQVRPAAGLPGLCRRAERTRYFYGTIRLELAEDPQTILARVAALCLLLAALVSVAPAVMGLRTSSSGRRLILICRSSTVAAD
jgi:hypothetical protein